MELGAPRQLDVTRRAPKLVECPEKFVKVLLASIRKDELLSKHKLDLCDRLVSTRVERDLALCKHLNGDIVSFNPNFEK